MTRRHKTFRREAFVGLNGRTGIPDEIPGYFTERFGNLNEIGNTFSQMYHSLPRAMTTEVAWRNPASGKWETTDRFNAVVNPDKVNYWDVLDEEEREQEAEQNPLLNVPTDSYSVVNPVDFYEPFEDAMMNEDMTDVFGWVSRTEMGDEAHINVMFTGEETPLPDEAEGSLFSGIKTGYSHTGDVALYAEGFVQDTTCSNSMRGLTDRKERRHVGEARDAINWWEDVLAAFGAIPDFLGDMIEEAMSFDLEIGELPFDSWQELYETAGYPEYLANAAASHAMSRSDNPFAVDAWNLHSGATYALTHTFRGNEESDRLQEYNHTANDILQNPAQFLNYLQDEYRRRQMNAGVEAEEVQEGVAQIESYEETVEDRKETYNRRQEELEGLLAGVGDSADAE